MSDKYRLRFGLGNGVAEIVDAMAVKLHADNRAEVVRLGLRLLSEADDACRAREGARLGFRGDIGVPVPLPDHLPLSPLPGHLLAFPDSSAGFLEGVVSTVRSLLFAAMPIVSLREDDSLPPGDRSLVVDITAPALECLDGMARRAGADRAAVVRAALMLLDHALEEEEKGRRPVVHTPDHVEYLEIR